MGTSIAEVTDDSATISDEEDPSGDTNSDGDTDGNDEAFDSPTKTDSSPFREGEKVFAFHSGDLYEAKVLRVEFRANEWKYYVHYLVSKTFAGWSKNWDEWVGIDCLMKFTDENKQKKEALKQKKENGKSTMPGPVRGKKRKNDDALKEDTAPPEKLFNIQISPTLRKQLVDDCEYVNHLGKLVKLPCTPTVNDILKKYREYRLKKDSKIADSVKEILNGLLCYFNKALPRILLYKSERYQYQKTVTEDMSPSDVYGAEHLLRLFVKLPELLRFANIEEETLAELQPKIMDILRFLQKNHSSFFLSAYETNTTDFR
ncbi:hypothetical protein LguiB_017332 [Lonicera macranthoides]